MKIAWPSIPLYHLANMPFDVNIINLDFPCINKILMQFFSEGTLWIFNLTISESQKDNNIGQLD